MFIYVVSSHTSRADAAVRAAAARLPDHGAAAEYRGGQREVRGELQQLVSLARQVKSPSLIIIGSVVTLADKLDWYGEANTLTGV
ncbi:hypothetical protein RY972_12705 [Aeromonas allosaccharophila]|uniref:Uncharacterized protein n=1 Tax=Aeromonas allosaccharophila TaxID=656 RepID=A0ABZ0F6E4_9GAMM|nr:hypothetical protein [Aeromonas allosaccharophila]WOE64936.1 hypothetical protein RY972_12705 [Aeromonas allosaccharophila]